MEIMFLFHDDTPPLIARSYKQLFKIINKYYISEYSMFGDNCYMIEGLRQKRHDNRFKECRENIRDFAIEWQRSWQNANYSYYEVSVWEGFFNHYGKRYGLLTEFRENCIC